MSTFRCCRKVLGFLVGLGCITFVLSDDVCLEMNEVALKVSLLRIAAFFLYQSICHSSRMILLLSSSCNCQANIMDHTGPDASGSELSKSMGPPGSARALAMIHLAMFEAYNCCEQKDNRISYFEEYADDDIQREYEAIGCKNRRGLTEVAVAEAVYTVMNGMESEGLIGLYGPPYGQENSNSMGQTIMEMADESRERVFCNIPTTIPDKKVQQAKDIGQKIAKLVLMDRLHDGFSRNCDESDDCLSPGEYIPTGEDGDHDVDPLNQGQGFFSPQAGNMPLFGMTSSELKNDFRAPQPSCLANDEFSPNDEEYLQALQQVRDKGYFRGGDDGDVPTDDLTYIIANYWSCNGSPNTGTPPVMYNDIVRKIAIEMGNDLHQNCLLFALTNLALANSGISAWDSKFHWRLWRPIQGIRNQANPNADKNWTPLGASRSNPWPDL